VKFRDKFKIKMNFNEKVSIVLAAVQHSNELIRKLTVELNKSVLSTEKQ